MAKHTKSINTNSILKTVAIIAAGSGLFLAGVAGTMMFTAPDNTPVSSFHGAEGSSSSVQSSSSTEESKPVESTTQSSSQVQLQGADVTTRESAPQTTTQSSSNSYDETTTPSHGEFQEIYHDNDIHLWKSPEGIGYAQQTGISWSRIKVQTMIQYLYAMGVRDMGNIDRSKMNDYVTGLSADITKPSNWSIRPVYIYTDNTPAAYTLK